jgi:hypothetical protein
MTLRAPRVLWVGLALLPFAVACKPAPDVVATNNQSLADSGDAYLQVATIDGCKPGRYVGTVVSDASTDGGPSFPFEGDIKFSLVNTGGGEFLTLSNDAVLCGTTDTGATFTATIDDGDPEASSYGCRAGAVISKLTGGQFSPPSLPAAIPFHGSIDGDYIGGKTHAFVGTWKAFLDGPYPAAVAHGNWIAQLVANTAGMAPVCPRN